jgi:hypothetical protein
MRVGDSLVAAVRKIALKSGLDTGAVEAQSELPTFVLYQKMNTTGKIRWRVDFQIVRRIATITWPCPIPT